MFGRLSRWCVVLVLFLGLGVVPCQAEIKVLSLKHITAEKVLPVMQDVLEGQGRVSAWENRLIVNASAEEIGTLEKVLEQIDVPPTMLRISIRQDDRQGQAGNRVVMTEPKMTDRTDSTASASSPGSSASKAVVESGTRRLNNTGEQTTQTLRLRDQSKGFILMGERVPYVQDMLILARRYAGFGQEVDFQAVSTGYWVRPILERGFVTLEIQPHLEGLQRNGPRSLGMPATVELQELSSTVRVPLGQWVDLGHQLREADEISRAILTWRTSNLHQERTIWVKVDSL